jgi:hypothetical protein
VVLFGGAGGPAFPTSVGLARSLNEDWGPAIMAHSTTC